MTLNELVHLNVSAALREAMNARLAAIQSMQVPVAVKDNLFVAEKALEVALEKLTASQNEKK